MMTLELPDTKWAGVIQPDPAPPKPTCSISRPVQPQRYDPRSGLTSVRNSTAWSIPSAWPASDAVAAATASGFMDNHDPHDQTLMLRFLARISGTKYGEDATGDARRRIIEFFNRYLKDSETRPRTDTRPREGFSDQPGLS